MTAITGKTAVILKGITGKRNMGRFWTRAVVPWVLAVKPFIKRMLHVLCVLHFTISKALTSEIKL